MSFPTKRAGFWIPTAWYRDCMLRGGSSEVQPASSGQIELEVRIAPKGDEKKPGAVGLVARLVERGARVISYGDWQKVDRAEVERGEPKGKPREKFTTVGEMLAALD